MRNVLLLFIAVSLCEASWAGAQSTAEMELREEIRLLKSQMQDLGAVVRAQAREIDKLKGEVRVDPMPLSQVPAVPTVSTPSLKRGPTPYLPELGLVADMVATSSESLSDEEGNDRLSVREVEVVFGSDIDPYARLDATLSFSDLEEVELEEAYASYWGLPGELKARIGRFHQRVGKAAAIHRDSLDTVDEPFVIQRYLGEHGIHQTGFDLEAYSPLSTDTFTQNLTLGVLEGGMGHGGTLFGSRGGKPTLYAHLGNSLDFGDSSSFELGGTYLLGANQLDQSFKVNALGLDATYLYRMTGQRKLKLQSEIFWQNRTENSVHEHELSFLKHSHEETESGEHEDDAIYDANSRGLYVLADFRFSPRWGAGMRYDWVQPVEVFDHYMRSEEEGYSAYLSFYQSEFARWRLQYQRASLLDGESDDRFFLQGTFAIGTHKHQLQ